MAFPTAWTETALVSISKLSGTDIEFAAITSTVEINEGDYPGESVATIAGGRVWKQSPQEDGEITMDIYPIELDSTTGVGLFQQFAGGTYDTSEPLASDSSWLAGVSRIRDSFRVAVLWTNDTAATTGFGATAASTDGLRFYATDCRITSHKASFSDNLLKATVTFKFPAFNKAGTTKIGVWQSGDNTALVTLGSYT